MKMIKPVTNVRLMRKNGLGVSGSIANAEHHAQAMLPIIDTLKEVISDLGFTDWVAGHNVHELHTHDGKRYTLRAYTRDKEYVGVRLALRISRSMEYQLIDAETLEDVELLIKILGKLARGIRGDKTPLLSCA